MRLYKIISVGLETIMSFVNSPNLNHTHNLNPGHNKLDKNDAQAHPSILTPNLILQSDWLMKRLPRTNNNITAGTCPLACPIYLFKGAGEEVNERQSEHDPQDPTLAQEPTQHHGGVLLDVHQIQVDAIKLFQQHCRSHAERSA